MFLYYLKVLSTIMVKDWIGKAKVKPGALHRELHINESKPIPTPLLRRIQKAPVGAHIGVHKIPVTPLLKHRAQFALNMRNKNR